MEQTELLTTKAAARVIDRSERTLTAIAQRGAIKHLRDSSGRRLYQRKDLIAYQDDQARRRQKRGGSDAR